MAKTKQSWTSDEVKALTDGVRQYGTGKWKAIKDDPMYGSALCNRSNVDLKDKWRNMSVSENGPTRRKMTEGTSRRSSEKRRPPLLSKYNDMIFDALRSFEDPDGTNLDSIDSYLRGKYKVPKNFGILLTGKIRRLVLSGEIEKVDERYKRKGGETSQAGGDTMALIIDNRDNEQVGTQNRIYLCPDLNEEPVEQVVPLNFNLNEEPVEPLPTERLEDVAGTAAVQIAVSENLESREIKGYQEKKNKLAGLLEESVAMLNMANDLYEKCRRDGTVILRS